MQKRVDGLLLLCTETHQPSREIMERYPSIPTVMMDWSPFDGEGDSDLIQDNSLLGGDLATQYLIDKVYPNSLYYRPAGQNASAFTAGRVSGGDETRRAGYSARL